MWDNFAFEDNSDTDEQFDEEDADSDLETSLYAHVHHKEVANVDEEGVSWADERRSSARAGEAVNSVSARDAAASLRKRAQSSTTTAKAECGGRSSPVFHCMVSPHAGATTVPGRKRHQCGAANDEEPWTPTTFKRRKVWTRFDSEPVMEHPKSLEMVRRLSNRGPRHLEAVAKSSSPGPRHPGHTADLEPREVFRRAMADFYSTSFPVFGGRWACTGAPSWDIVEDDRRDPVIVATRRQLLGGRARFRARARPQRARPSQCRLCGENHGGRRWCSNSVCSVCWRGGHEASCCRVDVAKLACNLCGRKGHVRRQCPDSWRFFHSTTTTTCVSPAAERPPRPSSCATRSEPSCYSCGRKGHCGDACDSRGADGVPGTRRPIKREHLLGRAGCGRDAKKRVGPAKKKKQRKFGSAVASVIQSVKGGAMKLRWEQVKKVPSTLVENLTNACNNKKRAASTKWTKKKKS